MESLFLKDEAQKRYGKSPGAPPDPSFEPHPAIVYAITTVGKSRSAHWTLRSEHSCEVAAGRSLFSLPPNAKISQCPAVALRSRGRSIDDRFRSLRKLGAAGGDGGHSTAPHGRRGIGASSRNSSRRRSESHGANPLSDNHYAPFEGIGSCFCLSTSTAIIFVSARDLRLRLATQRCCALDGDSGAVTRHPLRPAQRSATRREIVAILAKAWSGASRRSATER